jgi:hypothetical protein
MLRVSTQQLSDGTSVSLLIEGMSRNKYFFQVRISHVLHPFVTHLLTLPRKLSTGTILPTLPYTVTIP